MHHDRRPRLGLDDAGASPIVVIATVVVVVAGLAALAFFVFADVAGPELALQQVERDGAMAFQVVQAHGKLDWSDLTVRLVDPAGYERAATYLTVPTGPVEVGQQIQLARQMPSGTWLLTVAKDGAELARLAVVVP